MKTITILQYYIVFVLLVVTISLWEFHEYWVNSKKSKKTKVIEKRRFYWQKYYQKQSYKLDR
jgi:hypothetical protein